MARIFKILLYSSLGVILACAQSRPLSGGEKDTSPPKLVRSSPDTFSTNFNSQSIRLEFDEFVKLEKINQNLLITPVMREDPNIIVSGKKVLIKQIDDSLWPNTTYVMEFNEAIRDITENNAAKGFRYVFSTGSHLDSLQISGQVKDAFTLKPMEDVYVFLYDKQYDSIPYKEKPRYIGRSNESGTFTIRNMKAGEYKVFMCTDDNRNYIYDRPGDKIDFMDSPIYVSADSTPLITGHLFKEDKGIQALESYGLLNNWAFYLSFRKQVDTLDIEFMPESSYGDAFKRNYNDERDSVVFWLTDSSQWQEEWNLSYKADTFKRDTIKLVHYDKKIVRDFKMTNNLDGKFLNLGDELEYYFDYPLVDIDTSKISFEEDSVPHAFDWRISQTGKKLIISTDWTEKRKFRLTFDAGAFKDVNGLSNDSTSKLIVTRERKFYGTMDISLDGLEPGKGILILLDKKGNVVEKVLIDNKENHYFEFLNPGEYLLKYIVDENENGKWDPGDYLAGKHSEPVFIYQGSITIRSNWDQVIEWKFNQ